MKEPTIQMKRIAIILGFIAALILIYILYTKKNSHDLTSFLHEQGFDTNLVFNTPILKMHNIKSDESNSFFFSIDYSNSAIINFSVINLNDFQSAMALKLEKSTKIRSIYDTYRDPYFSSGTKRVECEKDFLPKIISYGDKNESAFTMLAFSNDRNTWGACSEKMASKRASITILNCKNSVLQVETFFPIEANIEDQIKIANSFKCL